MSDKELITPVTEDEIDDIRVTLDTEEVWKKQKNMLQKQIWSFMW